MTLVEFLLARIAEDEAAARAASFRTWRYDPTKVNAVDRGEAVFAGPRGAAAVTVASTGPADDPQSMADADHIARHDPARVLAECGAKRRIVERESGAYTMRSDLPPELTPIETEWRSNREVVHVAFGDGTWETMSDATFRERFMRPAESEVLRLLAAVHADHPDYDESWRA